MWLVGERWLISNAEGSGGNGFGVEGGFEIGVGADAGHEGAVATGGCFPEREVIEVGFLVTLEDGGFDAVGVTRLGFGVDELVVALPVRGGLFFGVGDEDDGTALALAEEADGFVGVLGEEEVGEEDAEGVGAEGDFVCLLYTSDAADE